jgi:tRNA pseudouridine13 synthase
MKLKEVPEDFQVEERTGVRPGAGPFALYRLEKMGWTTPDALAVVRRRWHLEPARLSCGGLKDRHAATVQYLTIFHGPRRHLRQPGLALCYLGQVPAAYTSKDICANRFRLTLRDLAAADRPAAEAALARGAAQGVPNYFDDQRFGSAAGGEFVGRLLVRGQFEEALRLALAAPYEHDRSAQKEEKRLLAEHWGDWQRLAGVLPPARAAGRPIEHLRLNPGDFRGAFLRLPAELRTLYLSAYQSHLWNRILARWLERHCRPEQLRPVRLRLGAVPFHGDLAPAQLEELARLQVPLPSARWRPAEADPLGVLAGEVLAEEGLALSELRVKGVRELFFSRGERAALCRPAELGWEFAADERHPGRVRLTLHFELPRGSYATLLAKAVSN